MNGSCGSVGGCDTNSAQYRWLVQDLASSTRPCTAAHVHQTYFTSSNFHPQDGAPLQPMVQALYSDGAELLVQGHEHQYESFAPQTPGAFVTAPGGTTPDTGSGTCH